MTVTALAGEVLNQWGVVVLASGPGDQVNGIGAPAGVPDLVMFSALVGTFMPPLVAIVQQPRWSPIVRALVVILSSVGIGAVTASLEGQLTGQRWTTSALLVGTAAVAAYRLFWHRAAATIEHRTSGQPDPAAGRR
jgi:uncharacterized membrane-anchored protein